MNVVRLYVLLIFVAACASLSAQSKQVKTGPAKAWIKNIDFDKNASPAAGQESSFYYLLLDEQENIAAQEDFIHYAYKILTNDGLQQMSDLSVEFDPSYEQLTVHSVLLHRNGKSTSQLPRQIRTIQREQSMDRYLYDGTVTAVINLTDVRVGDIIEYSVTRKGYNPIYGGYVSRKIKLNYTTPFEKAYKRLVAPSSLTFSFKYVNTDSKPETEKTNDLTSYTWLTSQTKGLLSDNHEPDWYNPYSYVLITTFKDWGEVASWATSRYQVSEGDRQLVLKEIVPQLKSDSQEEYALKAIRFVQDEIRYLGFESGLNSHQPHAPAKVYQQRFGDCKDKSLLLATLLNAKGIESHPVLLNTTYRDKITDQLPSTNAFDHCVVQVKMNDRVFYIDPTINNQGGTIDNYYFPAYGKGLVVSSSTSGLTDFPSPIPSSISEVQTFDISTIGGEGMLTVKTTYTGSEAESQRSYFSNDNVASIQKGYLNYYGNLYPDIQTFDTVQTEDNRKANIFIVKEKYKIPAFWKPSKDKEGKIYCEFYAQTLESYFSVSKSAQRTSPYRLAYPLNYEHEIHVNMPEAWNIPLDEESIKTDYYDYEYKVDYAEGDDKQFTLRTYYQTRSSSLPVSDFPKFVKDHEKMMSNLSYSLTYDPSLVHTNLSKWPGMALTIFTLALAAYLVFWVYRNYDPQPYYPPAWGQAIGGWLVLIGIGISLTPIRILYSLITEDHLLSGQVWMSQWYAGNYAISAFIFFEQIYNVTYLLFSVLVVILFFQRRSSVPLLVTILYAVSGAMTILDSVVSLQIDPDGAVDKRAIFQAIFVAAIWIPYFRMSIRVKKTFVNVYHDEGSGEPLQPVTA